MAFSILARVASGADSTSSTTASTGVPNIAFSAGDLVIVTVSCDNTSTTDGNTNEVLSVDDSVGGNTYVKLHEFCNGQGAAAAGVTVAAFYSVLVNGIGTSGTSITATFANTIGKKTIFAVNCSIAAGKVPAVAAVQDIAVDGAAGIGAPSISGLVSESHLYLLLIGAETSGSEGTSVTGMSFSGVGVVTSGGASATNIFQSLRMNAAVDTGLTPGTSGGNAIDKAIIFMALKESTPVTFAADEDFPWKPFAAFPDLSTVTVFQ